MSVLALRPVRQRMIASWIVALALGGLAFQLADVAYRTLPRPHPLAELSYYPSGRHLRPATLGQAETAADLAWLRAVQYYGEHRTSDGHFLQMEHVFDIVTTLAPSFISAYVFGGFALAQEGQSFPAAERLMLKGIAANPRDGRLAFELGFLYYVRPGGRDLERAAEYFERAARLPNGPPVAGQFAAFARQHAGDLAIAYALWSRVIEQSENHYLREIAEREMAKIRVALQSGRKEVAVKRLPTPRVIVRSGS
jgi:Flp pilus assembly protein TadD